MILAQLVLPRVDGGALVIVALAVLGCTTTLADESDVGLWYGFGECVTWLVTCAVLISLCVSSTGLGSRLAYLMLQRLGHSNLGIAYAIGMCEMLLGPAVPSNTARGGGVIAPVVEAIVNRQLHNENKVYFTIVAFNMNLVSSAAFLSAAGEPASLVAR